MNQKLRIGIVGAGAIVRSRHAPALVSMPRVGITAVCNSSPASARAFAADFCPDAQIFSRWEELVASPDLDIIWIGATPHLHEPVTLAALAANHHVFCQARMAPNLAAAERMLQASRQKPNLVTMLCPPPYGLAEDAFVRRCLADAGPIRQVFLRSWDSAWLNPCTPLHWRQRADLSGHNIMTLGIFTEVLQRWIGPVDELHASGKTWVAERPGGHVDTPDVLQVGVQFAGDIPAQWSFSGIYPGSPRQELEVLTSSQALHFDFATGQLRRRLPNGSEEILTPLPGELRPWQVEADFINAVRQPDAPRPEPDFETGTAYMRVVEAVAQSLRSGQSVKVL